MRNKFTIVEASELVRLVCSAQHLLDLIQTGEAVSNDDASRDKATRAADATQYAIDAIAPSVPDDMRSPFLEHRDVILGGYSTAQRLQSLVLHLWNDGHEVRLGTLFGNADNHHTRIALDLITSYTRHGENDPAFMRLADEIRDMRAAAKARESKLEHAY